MYLRIEMLPKKKLVGKRLTMSFAGDRTPELWRSFMPRKKEILNAVGTALFSLQIYEQAFDFQPGTPFEKWAAIEITDFNNIPDGLEQFILQSGLYAVFLHQGTASDFAKTFGYIFNAWLPNAAYTLDARPHFELLGEKYINNDPHSEEEVWIPIKPKA